MTIAYSAGNDIIIPTVAGETLRGGAGDDTYVFASSLVEVGSPVVIDDTEGSNTLQFLDGLTIESSIIYNDALQLTLSNGGVVRILSASLFDYNVGGNVLTGDAGTDKSFAEFVTQNLAATVPAEGDSPSTGGSVTIGNSGGGDTVNMASGNTYIAVNGNAEIFTYDIDSSSGRAVQADGEVEIQGFNVSEDMLRFVDTGNGAITTANFETFTGVAVNENPFDDYTSIYFDPVGTAPGGIIIHGVQDLGLDTIAFEVA